MMIGVCGVACEACPRRMQDKCPNGGAGCTARENPFCEVCTCAYRRGVDLCFRCPDFPCDTTGKGPISHGYCQYISGKD